MQSLRSPLRWTSIFLVGIVALSIASAQPSPNRPRREGPPPPPPGTVAHQDLPYVTDGHERQKLDLYLPEHATGPLPLVIWIHGGGWTQGDKYGCMPLGQKYSELGYAVASIGYRLSQHAPFPAQIEDCKAAIRWLRAHAETYGLDPNRFGVWGSSAGGHLVALVGTTSDVTEFDVGENLDFSSAVQAVCDFYGPTDFLQMDAHRITGSNLTHDDPQSPESRLIGAPIQQHPDLVDRANPITFVTAGDPPTLIVHGDRDLAVPPHQSQLLYAALESAGVPSGLKFLPGVGHGGPAFSTPAVKELVQRFFARYLGGQVAPAPTATATNSVSTAASSDASAPASPRGRPTFAEALKRMDADQDGKISREEFLAPAAVFERLDRNRDGFLTAAEHDRTGP